MNDNDKGWLQKKGNIDKLIKGLYAACALSILAEFFVHMHPHSAAEKIPGFYGIFGFIAFFCVVRGGQALRLLVKRDENYYD